eukprot:c18903_g1_i1 orf=365-1264(-)
MQPPLPPAPPALTCLLEHAYPYLLILLFIVPALHCATGLHLDDERPEKPYGVYTYTIVNEYNHNPQAFTQGLVYAGNDTFYESTGLYGSSSVRKVYIRTGEILQIHQMENKYFGEGLAIWNHRLLQVAWKVTFGFIYDDETLNLLGTFKHPMTDGWGLATDGKVLYGSDGTSTIYLIEPSTLEEIRKFTVKDQEKEISMLNELEYVHDELWANVWQTSCIVRISPESGEVLGWILLQKLRDDLLAGDQYIDVLNGIAWDEENDRIFVTGKLWPKLYEIKVYPREGNTNHREEVWKLCEV